MHKAKRRNAARWNPQYKTAGKVPEQQFTMFISVGTVRKVVRTVKQTNAFGTLIKNPYQDVNLYPKSKTVYNWKEFPVISPNSQRMK